MSKLTDADTENSETVVWRDFSFKCEYITHVEHDELYADAEETERMIAYMIEKPSKFLPQKVKNTPS